MDCCDFVYMSMDTYFSLTCGVCVSLLCAYLCHLFLTKYRKGGVEDEASTCKSAQCFRCSSNKSLKQLVRQRFLNYCKSENRQHLSRLQENVTETEKGNGKMIQKPTLFFMSKLPSHIWFDSRTTHKNDIESLERNFGVILNEYQNVINESGWIINENRQGCWKVYHLISQGRIVVNNASKCPQTMNLLRSLDSLMIDTIFGYATFSVMEPQSVISPHFGSTNCRVRCHLGLQVDPETCYITVGDQKRSWKVGKCLIFDDSFLHSAYHKGGTNSDVRVIFMIDLWHPELTEAERQCIRTVYSSELLSEYSVFTD